LIGQTVVRRLVAIVLLTLPTGMQASDRVRVAASFSILADLVRQVGGDRVDVAVLVGPNSDAHVFQPSPNDAKKIAEAELLVVNGLGFEGWMGRLQKSSGFKGTTVVATTGIKLRLMAADESGEPKRLVDPHAWQNLANGRIYVQNIRDGLIAADPDDKAVYEANTDRYLAEIDSLDAYVKASIARLPPSRRRIITSHDAFGYFGAAYGLDIIAPQGVSTESEASAQDVAKIIRQIKAQKIPAIFIENISDPRLLEQISRETGAKVGGTLYSDALSDAKGPAGTYLDLFRHNIETFMAALSS
jgi:zinc/manganese transport system substrate-binding protein